MRILLVDDDDNLAMAVRRILEEAGYAVDWAPNSAEANYYIDNCPYDLVLLDRILPEADGLEILKRMRERRNLTPVIMVTVRGEVPERINGLSQGADDYVVKPFDYSELLVRIRAVLRRSAGIASDRMEMDDLVLDLNRRRVSRADEEVVLTRKEFAVVEYLLRKREHVVSRGELIEHLYDESFDKDSNLIDVFIHKVRQKIDHRPHKKLIHTVRGTGYVMSDQRE